MKKIKYFGLVCLAVVSVFCFMAGCEDDSSTDIESLDGDFSSELMPATTENPGGLSISPESATITKASQQVTFNVSGGDKPYTWSVSSSGAGSISPTTSANQHDSVVYTSSGLAGNTVVVVDSKGRRASADISASTKALSISPSSATFLASPRMRRK